MMETGQAWNLPLSFSHSGKESKHGSVITPLLGGSSANRSSPSLRSFYLIPAHREQVPEEIRVVTSLQVTDRVQAIFRAREGGIE